MSLFTWLLIFSIACFVTFAVARFTRTAQLEADAIRGLENLGLDVTFKYEHELGRLANHVSPGPDWVKALFGDKVLAKIEFVRLSGKMKTLDDCTEYLSQLSQLKNLAVLSNELESIDALKHLTELEKVSFAGNLGGMKNVEALSSLNLRNVTFFSYNGITSLDSLGKIASLEVLSIRYCNGIKELNLNDWKARNLQKVHIEDCSGLVTLSGPPQGSESCSLSLSNCSDLEKIMFQRSSSLGNISIKNCNKLESIGVQPKSRAPSKSFERFDSLEESRRRKPPKLSSAFISSCNRLVSIDAIFQNAEAFSLTKCDSLEDLDLAQFIPLFERVSVESCKSLVEINGLPESVKSFKLIDCQSLKQVTPADKLPNLEQFKIKKCPNLLTPPNVKVRKISW